MIESSSLTRDEGSRESVEQRLTHFKEFTIPLSVPEMQKQGARCLDCGVPFCQGPRGCPVQNLIPDWNELVLKNQWKKALDFLHETNNFPEFTGKLCPAPCESVCVMGIHKEPVTIRSIESSIVERGFQEGWIKPQPAPQATGHRVAIVGSGPAGLAAAQQLARQGHSVVVYEKSEKAGGLLRFGIPDFKFEKHFIDRRLDQLQKEGVEIKTGITVGVDISWETLQKQYQAIGLACGAEAPRDLSVSGRQLKGVHFAMEYLTHQNRLNDAGHSTIPTGAAAHGSTVTPPDFYQPHLIAKGKKVVVIGGGDTGADCFGTALRQGCHKVTQFEILPRPAKYKVSTSHEEGAFRGGDRKWGVSTLEFLGDAQGNLRGLRYVEVDFKEGKFIPRAGTEKEIECQMVLLAMGFTGVRADLFQGLQVPLNPRGSVIVDQHMMTATRGVFAAGDVKRGASLIVWAIAEGRQMAEHIHQFLTR